MKTLTQGPRLTVQCIPNLRDITVTEEGQTVTVSANCRTYDRLCRDAAAANLPTPAALVAQLIESAILKP